MYKLVLSCSVCGADSVRFRVRSGMMQYAAVIQRLFTQTLSAWTAVPEANVGQQRAYSSVRVSVYRTLELWVQLFGASANILQGASSHAEILFNHMLGDITPGAESVKLRAGLSVDVVPGGKPGPRRTKQLVIADTVGTSLQRKGDPLSNQDTCLSALKVLRLIIQTSGTLLKDDIHKRLHEVVLPLCVRLQQQQSSSIAACESVGSISGQYSSALARRELYRLLLALVLVPSPCWPPPLTCAVSILSNGRIDRNLKVSSFCAEALTICNSILHPRTPSIALPLPPLALKPTPSPSVLSCQGPTPRLTLPTLLGGPAPGPPFSARHPLGLAPNSLLGSLENHLSLVPGLPGQASAPGELMLSPPMHSQPDPPGLGPPEGQRPVFVRYDKEEAEDVEISLASDSDDSVVIVPPGMLSMENQLDDPASNSQNILSSAPGGTCVTLAGGDAVTMVPTTAAPTTLDVTSLPNDLVTSSALLTTSSTPVNSFPPSSGSVVSLVSSLNSSSASAPAGGLADSIVVKPQLQQMLMQASTSGQPNPMALPLQMHQLQNQLAQQGRHLHQHPPAPASNEESAVININSTDDEDEDEEDMEDDEELEEEEDGIDEEDEEEEGSEEFYEGEEYEDFDEEELEDEEEDEDGDMPPLEGSEDKSEEVAMEEEEEEEEKALQANLEEGEVAGYSVEGDTEGGIEELQTSRSLFGEERMKVQEVESIGVLEEAREVEGEEDESERMDDPTMPQILCVTGGALEERCESSQEAAEAAGELQEKMNLWDQSVKENEPITASEEGTTSQSLQESVAESVQEAGVREEQPAVGQDEALQAGAKEEEASAAPSVTEQEQTEADRGDIKEAEWTQPDRTDGGGGEKEEEGGKEQESNIEEEKGVKRKREEENVEEETGQSPEKKKDDEAMASMLADFVACPPDDEDVASGSNHS
ncbi:hypothetical protein XENORESO_002606 [Xenotaenia resolanae]|uniref:PELP1 middle domain-containing protein n=1 Tax=Xenotaenia resolanae TaxID=208358 RepID=A0ABV0WBP0_9TELE